MFPPKSTGKRFAHDQTLKSLFAERDVVRDLLDFHAADLFPELQGFKPLELVSASTVTADATSPNCAGSCAESSTLKKRRRS